MTAMQRTKGTAGEREACAIIKELTGRDVRRRVRQHEGDSDLEGLPGWSIEVKRHATFSEADLAAFWKQAVAQAERTGAKPLLIYRKDRGQWRCRWPVTLHQDQGRVLDTLDADPLVWWWMCRRLL
jgi:hypothetical protein